MQHQVKTAARQLRERATRRLAPADIAPEPKIKILRVDILKPAQDAAADARLEAMWADAESAFADYGEPSPTEGTTSATPKGWTGAEVAAYVASHRGDPLPPEVCRYVQNNPEVVVNGRVRLEAGGIKVRFYVPREWLS